ncbi:phosphomannomutase [Neomicrococcus aestuarii]|uniref:Phosphomannomutase n=1 Tax=Neomicrococcus aestuarii TaxID=556325 RepID=A0A7W8TRB7_9MICC|nr:phospho-sugar mutase [Neomicrococcus aestuarii]MBB5511455.1 phosphomannomutase [Neomicrococcus aestuarii]
MNSGNSRDALLERARHWAAEDPDPQTQDELTTLIESLKDPESSLEELEDRFGGTLEFGTAGLRAALGAGPMRMNRVVVRRTAAGLAEFLATKAAGAYVPRVVVGYDARHNSYEFALESASVFTARGFEVLLMPSALPTPVLAFSVRHFDADCGVMVTASHNPAQDNGYKVYLGGRVVADSGQGAQIVTPLDQKIAAAIDYSVPLSEIPLAQSGWTVRPDAGEDDDVAAAYETAVADAVAELVTDEATDKSLPIVLTPLHGVGGRTMENVLRAAGFTNIHVVAEQAQPDPDFPTVSFPNPEEAGAIDMALALAESVDAALVIANDPDADRCAIAINGVPGWRMLRGDELGSIFGEYIAQTAGTKSQAVFANSIVSSRRLAAIAAAHEIAHEETLTGFKWISRVPDLTFGYEEALGYCVAPDVVRDKDGISAGLLIAEIAAQRHALGQNLQQDLDDLDLKYGLCSTDQLSVRVSSLDLLGAMMGRLRSNPPESLGGSPVESVIDLSAEGGALPSTDGMKYSTADGTRVIVRPSGTEPKLKCYLEVHLEADGSGTLDEQRHTALERLSAVREDVSESLGL